MNNFKDESVLRKNKVNNFKKLERGYQLKTKFRKKNILKTEITFYVF